MSITHLLVALVKYFAAAWPAAESWKREAQAAALAPIGQG